MSSRGDRDYKPQLHGKKGHVLALGPRLKRTTRKEADYVEKPVQKRNLPPAARKVKIEGS